MINQTSTGTCLTASYGLSLLAQDAIDDPFQVIEDTTIIYTPNGMPLNDPPIKGNISGQPYYIVYLTTQEQVDLYNTNGVTQEFLDTFRGVNYETQRFNTIAPNQAARPPGDNPIRVAIETHYGVDVSIASNTDIGTALIALNNGNSVILNVANNIFRGNAVIDNAITTYDEFNPTAQTGNGHAITLSDVDYTDPDNPKVIFNDTATGEVRAEMPLDEFAQAFGAGGFHMWIVGNNQHFTPEQTALRQTSITLNNKWRDAASNNFQAHGQYTPQQLEDGNIPHIPVDVMRSIASKRKDVDTSNYSLAELTAVIAQIPIEEFGAYPELIPHLNGFDRLEDVPGYLDNNRAAKRQALIDAGIPEDKVDDLIQ